MTQAPVSVFLNPSAGPGEPDGRLAAVLEHFLALGLDAQGRFIGGHGELERAIHEAREQGRRIVVGGGDGTVGSAAAVLAGTEVPLGILPLGTRNHFARDAGIPLDLPAAVRVIAEGHTVAVDVAEVNGRVFINNASLGAYPILVQLREDRERSGQSRWRALLWATFIVFRRHPFVAVRVEAGDGQGFRRAPFVLVSNNRYELAGLNLTRRQTLRGGRVALYAVRRSGRLGVLVLACRAILGLLSQSEQFEAWEGTAIRIETRSSRVTMALDGEVVVMPAPLTYRIRPGALRLHVPARADAARA